MNNYAVTYGLYVRNTKQLVATYQLYFKAIDGGEAYDVADMLRPTTVDGYRNWSIDTIEEVL